MDEALAIARRAWPTKDLSREDICGLLEMLAGDWEHAQDKPVRPRLLYDRVHGIEGLLVDECFVLSLDILSGFVFRRRNVDQSNVEFIPEHFHKGAGTNFRA